MRPDGTVSRKYPIRLEGCELLVEEIIKPFNTHACKVHTTIAGETAVVTRLVVAADGSIVLGPVELYRRPGFDGDWLPFEFGLDEFVSLIRLRL